MQPSDQPPSNKPASRLGIYIVLAFIAGIVILYMTSALNW